MPDANSISREFLHPWKSTRIEFYIETDHNYNLVIDLVTNITATNQPENRRQGNPTSECISVSNKTAELWRQVQNETNIDQKSRLASKIVPKHRPCCRSI
jgi:hypothetical protein